MTGFAPEEVLPWLLNQHVFVIIVYHNADICICIHITLVQVGPASTQGFFKILNMSLSTMSPETLGKNRLIEKSTVSMMCIGVTKDNHSV